MSWWPKHEPKSFMWVYWVYMSNLSLVRDSNRGEGYERGSRHTLLVKSVSAKIHGAGSYADAAVTLFSTIFRDFEQKNVTQ
jgi:hypothetical protein